MASDVEAVAYADVVTAVAEVVVLEAGSVVEPIAALAAVVSIEASATEAGSPGAPGRQGPPGPSGNVGVTVEALVNLNAYTVVKVMGTGQARPASSLILGDGEATTGVTTAPALAGEQVPIRTVGAVSVSGTLPVGPLYLSTDGSLTPDHDSGLFQLRIGYAQTPTLLIVRIDPPIYSV